MDTEFRDAKGRFTKGNPGGPGRAAFSIVSIIQKQLEKIPDGYDKTYAELLVERYIQNALEKDDGIAIRDLVDRFDGKARQSLEVAGDIERPVGITVIPWNGNGHSSVPDFSAS